jgi:hypothetical protein
MSIGNLKDSGNQSNNFPYQLKVLQGLQAMIDGNCCSDTLEILSNIYDTIQPQQRVVKIISSTTAGHTDPDAYSMSIANVGAAAGTVNGVSLPAGVTLNFDAGALNNTFPDKVNFDATGTTFLVTVIISA